MVLGLVSVMAANLIETVYVGLLGTTELAALGFTFPLVMLLQSMTMGLAVGASSVVARLVGANDLLGTRTILSHSLILTFIFSVLVTLILFPNLKSVFLILGAGPETLKLALDYMYFWFIGFPFFAIAMVGSSLMRSVGDIAKPSYLMTIGAGLQIVLGPLFIFGFAGVESFGITGAAMAFVVARLFGFFLYVYFIYKDGYFVLSSTGFLNSCVSVFHVGLPAIAANLIGPITLSIITRVLSSNGEFVVAGFSLASRIETMLAMVMWGLSMSVAPFVGQNWGARQYQRAQKCIRTANTFALAWGILAYLTLSLIGPTLVSMVSEDPLVIEAATQYLFVAPLAIGFMGVTMNCLSSFNALGKPTPPMVISFLQMCVFAIPLALLGDYLFGYRGVFMAGVLSNLLTALMAYFWLRKYFSSRAW